MNFGGLNIVPETGSRFRRCVQAMVDRALQLLSCRYVNQRDAAGEGVDTFCIYFTTLIILLLLLSTSTYPNSTPFTWRERCFWTSEMLKIIFTLKFYVKENCCFYGRIYT